MISKPSTTKLHPSHWNFKTESWSIAQTNKPFFCLRTAFKTRTYKFIFVSFFMVLERGWWWLTPERTQLGKPLMIIMVWFATLSAKNRVLKLWNEHFTGMVSFMQIMAPCEMICGNPYDWMHLVMDTSPRGVIYWDIMFHPQCVSHYLKELWLQPLKRKAVLWLVEISLLKSCRFHFRF